MSAREPSALSEDATAFVGAFRQHVDVAVDVDVAWAQLEEAVEPMPGRRRVPMLWLGATAVLAAAVALIWIVGSATSLEGVSPPKGQQAADRAATESGSLAPSRESPPRRQPPAPESIDASPGPVEVSPRLVLPPGPAQKSHPRPRPTNPEPSASRLAEELRLLDAMRAASKAGRHAKTLRMVEEHAAAFTSGSFAAERELARVRALCGLGRYEQVRDAQARFAKNHAASHVAALVRGACPDAAKENQKTGHDE